MVERTYGGEEQSREPMDEAQLKRVAKEIIRSARDYVEREVEPKTDKAWRYYHGQVDAEPMGFQGFDKESGERVYDGSNVVVTECRDTVHSILPEVLRVFTSSEEAVEFEPENQEDVEGAEQATHHANYVWTVQNNGEELLNTALLDWCVKFTVFKVYHDEYEHNRRQTFSGLDEMAIVSLQEEEDVVELVADPREEQVAAQAVGPDGRVVTQWLPVTLYDGHFSRVEVKKKICIDVVPQEELLLDGDAQKLAECRCIGQDCLRPASDVIAMGIDEDTVMRFADAAPGIRDRGTTEQSRSKETSIVADSGFQDPALSWVRVVEANIKLDIDGDGDTETVWVVALGDEPEVVTWEEREDCEFVVASPHEIPHQVIGEGIVEITEDIQDIATALFRRVLDNLNRSVNPRPIITDWDEQAIVDVQSWWGGPIRAGTKGSIEWFNVPFVAASAFPVMDYVEHRRALRTGISPAGQGLDPDVLKGQTLEGAHAVVNAPQSRIEYYIRRFALSVMRPIFRAILRLSVRHQDQETVIRLRNRWVPVDPRAWNAEMDARPSVGLGTGTRGERLVGLNIIMQKQEQLLGIGSPMVTLEHYRHSLGKLAELVGEKDVDKYFKEFTPEELAALQQQAAQQQQSAVMAEAQAEAQKEQIKAQAEIAVETMKAQLEQATEERLAALKAQLEREKLAMQQSLKEQELRMEYQLEIMKMRAGSPGGNANLRAVG